MNPNSGNQLWSHWTFNVFPGRLLRRTFADVKANVARFGRKGFGSATECRIKEGLSYGVHYYLVEFRTEGKPAHDPQYVKYMGESFEKFFAVAFGPGTETHLDVKVEAGSKQDGKPASQLIILPTISAKEQVDG